MKQYCIILTIAISLLLSCNNDNEKLPDLSKITSKKNGQLWETNAVAFITNRGSVSKVSIPSTVRNEFGYEREYLHFGYIPLQLGSHNLVSFLPNSMVDTIYSSYTTLSDDGDVVEDRFVVFSGELNYIYFTTIDTINMKLCGNFQVAFIRDINDPIDNPNLPDTICFTEGRFCLEMISSK